MLEFQDLQKHAPVRLLKLEFQLPEVEFLQLLSAAESQLSDEEQALDEKQNVKEILRKHQQVFVDGKLTSRVEACFKRMRLVAKQLSNYDKTDTSLQEAVDVYTKRWQVLLAELDHMLVQLEQVPERWRAYNQR